MPFVEHTENFVYCTESKEANGEIHHVASDCKDLVGMVNHEADHDEISLEADLVELEMKAEEHASEENCSLEEGIECSEEVKSIECQSVEQVDNCMETNEEPYFSNEKVGCGECPPQNVERQSFEQVETKEEHYASHEKVGCGELGIVVVARSENECVSVEQVETKEEQYSSDEKVGCGELGIVVVERSGDEFTETDCEAYEEAKIMEGQSVEQADECEDMKAEEIADASMLSPEKHFPNNDVENDEFGSSTFVEFNHVVTNCASEIQISPLHTDLLSQNEMLQEKQIEVYTSGTHIEGDVLELLSHHEIEGEQDSIKPALLATVDVGNASSIHEACKTDVGHMVNDGILDAAADLPNTVADHLENFQFESHGVNPEGARRKENALESIEVTLTNSSADLHVDCTIAIVQQSFQEPDQILYEGEQGVHSTEQDLGALIIEKEETVCKVNIEGKSLRQIKKIAKELSKKCPERPEAVCGESPETSKQADLFADSQGIKDADSQCARLTEEMHHKCNLVDKENRLEDKSINDLKKILKGKLALRRKDNEAPTTMVRGLSENKSRANIQAQH